MNKKQTIGISLLIIVFIGGVLTWWLMDDEPEAIDHTPKTSSIELPAAEGLPAESKQEINAQMPDASGKPTQSATIRRFVLRSASGAKALLGEELELSTIIVHPGKPTKIAPETITITPDDEGVYSLPESLQHGLCMIAPAQEAMFKLHFSYLVVRDGGLVHHPVAKLDLETTDLLSEEVRQVLLQSKKGFKQISAEAFATRQDGVAILTASLLGQLRVNVMTSKGREPIADATVSVLKEGRNIGRPNETDESGVANFQRLEPGRYQVSARKKGFVMGSQAQIFEVVAGKLQTLHVEMKEGPALRGHVFDANGKPMAGAFVELRQGEEFNRVGSEFLPFYVATDDQGGFAFSLNLESQRNPEKRSSQIKKQVPESLVIWVRAGKSGCALHEVQDINQDQHITLKPWDYGTIRVKFVDEAKKPIQGVRVKLVQRDAAPKGTKSSSQANKGMSLILEGKSNDEGFVDFVIGNGLARITFDADGYFFGFSQTVERGQSVWVHKPGDVNETTFTGKKAARVEVVSPNWREGDQVWLRRARDNPDIRHYLMHRHHVDVSGVLTTTASLDEGKWVVGYYSTNNVLSHAEVVEVKVGEKARIVIDSRERAPMVELPSIAQEAGRYGFVSVGLAESASDLADQLAYNKREEIVAALDAGRIAGKAFTWEQEGYSAYFIGESNTSIPQTWLTFGYCVNGLGLSGHSAVDEPEVFYSEDGYHLRRPTTLLSAVEVNVSGDGSQFRPWALMRANWRCAFLPVNKSVKVPLENIRATSASLSIRYDAVRHENGDKVYFKKKDLTNVENDMPSEVGQAWTFNFTIPKPISEAEERSREKAERDAERNKILEEHARRLAEKKAAEE